MEYTKNPALSGGIFERPNSCLCSNGFLNFSGLDAIRAHLNALGGPVHHRANALQVGEKAPGCPVMGVADMVAGHRFLSTNLTNTCHCITPLIRFQFVAFQDKQILPVLQVELAWKIVAPRCGS
jgi:hypothetical protein